MQKRKVMLCAVMSLLMTAGLAMAAKSSVEYGKQLFNDQNLAGSTNEKSCNSCHANGKGLEGAGENEKLSSAINKCITGPLGGKKIDGRSAEMRSLKMYILSFGGE